MVKPFYSSQTKKGRVLLFIIDQSKSRFLSCPLVVFSDPDSNYLKPLPPTPVKTASIYYAPQVKEAEKELARQTEFYLPKAILMFVSSRYWPSTLLSHRISVSPSPLERVNQNS
jgi:hypothetical protein